MNELRRVVGVRGYRSLLFTCALNQLAWTLGLVVLAALVYRHTGSAVGATAFFLCGQFVPALLSPPIVARLDRFAPGPVLLILYASEAVSFLALAWFASRFSLLPVLALTIVDGVAASTARAITRAATSGVLAPLDLLRAGNAMLNAVWSISFMIGPAIGGVIVAAGGTRLALILNSSLFLAMGVAVGTAKALRSGSPTTAEETGRVRAAAKYILRHRELARLMGLQIVGPVFFTMSTPVEIVLAEHTLHAGARGYGALVAVWGAGAVAGSAIFARWRNSGARSLLALGAGGMGAGFALMAAAPTIALALGGAAVAGAGNALEVGAAVTALQERVEQTWMALVMSFDTSIAQVVPGLGILLGGVITALSTPQVALAVASTGALAISGLTLWLLRSPSWQRSSPVLETPPA